MNKKLLLVLIPIVVVIIAAIGVLSYMLIAAPSSNSLYLEQVENAEWYLGQGDVDQAIFYYQAAIEEDETQQEPYLALAKIYYEKKNDVHLCLDILYRGYAILGSQDLMDAINYYKGFVQEEPEVIDAMEATDGETDGMINKYYIDIFSTYSYKDYLQRFTLKSEKKDTGKYVVSYAQIDGEFEYKNPAGGTALIDSKTGLPYDNARPTEIRLNDISKLLFGVENGVTKDELMRYGALEIVENDPSVSVSVNHISFKYKNCTFVFECDENGVIKDASGYNCIVPPAANVNTQTILMGSIYNATDNSLVSNVELNFRVGKGVKTGNVYQTVDAPSGTYSVEIEPNDYTVEIKADGFITEFYDVYVPEGGGEIEQSFVISPKLQGKQMRFVVEWTNTQYDLYIHIHGRSSAGGTVDYWESRYRSTGDVENNLGGFDSGTQNGKRYTSATVMDYAGNYEFHVHAGYDLYQPDDLLAAGAVLKIYKDNDSEPIIVDVPSTFKTTGYYWVVCSVQNGNITYID